MGQVGRVISALANACLLGATRPVSAHPEGATKSLVLVYSGTQSLVETHLVTPTWHLLAKPVSLIIISVTASSLAPVCDRLCGTSLGAKLHLDFSLSRQTKAEEPDCSLADSQGDKWNLLNSKVDKWHLS